MSKAETLRALKAEFHVFFGGTPRLIVVPDGYRVVCFCKGHAPSVIPADIMPTGAYEIAPEPLPGQSYPIALAVIDTAHVEMICRIPTDKVDQMLATADNYRAQTQGAEP